MTQLRDYHNKIKFQLLHEFISLIQSQNKNDNILDIGVGRGGDMHKWNKCNVQNVYGIDPSKASIFEAIKRFKQTDYLRARNYKFYFYKKADGFMNIYNQKIQNESQTFNVITCMFAFHYFFMNETTLTTFFKNSKELLNTNGYLLITVPSGNEIKTLLKDNYVYENKSIRIEANFKHTEGLGDPIDFYLRDTLYFGEKIISKEYLVFNETVEKYAALYNFKIVKDVLFHDYLHPEINDNDDKIASSLNKIYVLQKC